MRQQTTLQKRNKYKDISVRSQKGNVIKPNPLHSRSTCCAKILKPAVFCSAAPLHPQSPNIKD